MVLGTQLREVIDAFGELMAEHVRLARVELAQDARFVGVRVGVIAALAPLIVVGYGLLCVALALALRRVFDADAAFALVGVLNLAIGLGGIAWAGKRLGAKRLMQSTIGEFKASTSVLAPRERGP
jgi:uncharacterized membrane protein YqjE